MSKHVGIQGGVQCDPLQIGTKPLQNPRAYWHGNRYLQIRKLWITNWTMWWKMLDIPATAGEN